MKKINIEVELSDQEFSILQELYPTCEYCSGYGYLDTTGTRKELEKAMKRLRDLGLVEYVKGLMTEDNEVAGSGFCRTSLGNDVIESINHNL